MYRSIQDAKSLLGCRSTVELIFGLVKVISSLGISIPWLYPMGDPFYAPRNSNGLRFNFDARNRNSITISMVGMTLEVVIVAVRNFHSMLKGHLPKNIQPFK